MSSPFVVPNGWSIQGWDKYTMGDGDIPRDCLPPGSYLEIKSEQNDSSFTLRWLDSRQNLWVVPGLQTTTPTQIEGKSLSVSFGKAGESNCAKYKYNVTATLISQSNTATKLDVKMVQLTEVPAELRRVLPTLGEGTFTATANPG